MYFCFRGGSYCVFSLDKMAESNKLIQVTPMTNYNHKFKKNLIADWIGRNLSAAIRGGVKTNLSPKAFITASVLVTSLAISPISHAGIPTNGQPIFINGVDETFSDSNASSAVSAKSIIFCKAALSSSDISRVFITVSANSLLNSPLASIRSG